MTKDEKSDFESIRVDTQNGAVLAGSFFDSPSNKGVVMLPGYLEHKSSLYDLAREVQKTGFKAWVFDLNSQGESSGDYNLSDICNSFDYVTNYLKKRHALRNIGGFGNSLGGLITGLSASRENSELESVCLAAAPAGLQDVGIHRILLPILNSFSQPVIRAGTILFDKFQTDLAGNLAYANLTHKQFKQNGKYQPYAQMGALKVRDIHKVAKAFASPERLDAHVADITQPILYVYGGEDSMLGVKEGNLPENIKDMYDSTASKNKRMVIVDGADHALSFSEEFMFIPMLDGCFNRTPEFSWVKKEIAEHFAETML